MEYWNNGARGRRIVSALLLGAGLLALGQQLGGAANPPAPVPPPIGSRTNFNPAQPRPGVQPKPAPAPQRVGIKTNAMPAAPRAGGKTNAVSAASPAGGTNSFGLKEIKEKFSRLQANRAFYPAVGAAILVLALILFRIFKSKSSKAGPVTTPALASKVAVKPSKRGASKAVHSCNVLEVSNGTRQVWQFDARGGGFALGRQQTSPVGESLPGKLVAKDWRSLFQHKLNIAWLPPEQVFLRVAQFPRSSFDETLAMVELQLEKLSPMPVAQIVWSLHILPHTSGNMQTVIVMIAARNAVEEFLGRLEGEGYLADRLELPLIDQLQATDVAEDGAWIYPGAAGGTNTAVVAWWYGGVLQSLDLLTLPPTNRPATLKEQLMQMAWAGEMDGWLTRAPAWRLAADGTAAAEWEPALRAGLEQPVEVVPTLAPAQLAALTARRSAHAEPRANLLPEEFSLRYRQQFVDRLWMRGLLALGGLYAAGVAIYLVAVAVATYRTSAVESQVAALGPQYTNAIQLKARFQVLNDRQELKFAALNCWNVTAKLIPDGVTLESLSFNEGKRLSLNGTAPSDQIQKLLDFEKNMRHAPDPEGQPLFDSTKGDGLVFHAQGPTATWNFSLELKRAEVQ